MGAPKNTPSQIIDKLNEAINAGLANPRLIELGTEPMPMSSGDFGRLIADETEKWGKVSKFAGIKAD